MRLLFLSLILLTGCVPKYSYQDKVLMIDLVPGRSQNIRVLAAAEEWRDSGVDVIAGHQYHASAAGKWRTYSTCNYTDADGLDLYNAACFKVTWFPTLVQGWTHSALVAKIGESGQPFGIGKDKEWQAQSSGRLFFRINDSVGTNWDNEGHVDVVLKQLALAKKEKDIELSTNVYQGKNATMEDKQHLAFQTIQQNHSDLKRVALIIGNSGYSHSPLKNPVNDAKDMAEVLKKVGFDVLLELDANQQGMEEAIDNFGRKLIPGSVALFYFAGHGVQVNGENYLIPVDAVINRQSDVRYKAVDTGQVLDVMGEGKNNLNIVILDACRNNPLPRSYRSNSRGLAKLDGPRGTILGFATSPGSVAADGENDNGVYTESLLRHIKSPGISIEQVFKKVLRDVDQVTDGQQTPWTESSFTGDFSFIK